MTGGVESSTDTNFANQLNFHEARNRRDIVPAFSPNAVKPLAKRPFLRMIEIYEEREMDGIVLDGRGDPCAG